MLALAGALCLGCTSDTDEVTDENDDTVITSYSIHYTKLYENRSCLHLEPLGET